MTKADKKKIINFSQAKQMYILWYLHNVEYNIDDIIQKVKRLTKYLKDSDFDKIRLEFKTWTPNMKIKSQLSWYVNNYIWWNEKPAGIFDMSGIGSVRMWWDWRDLTG